MDDYDFEDMLAYFSNFDNNKTGLLDFSEFAELVKSLGMNVSHEQLKEGFNKIDLDNNHSIDFEEFMAWWGKQN